MKRGLYTPKPGKRSEAIALFQKITEDLPYRFRIYTARIGPTHGTIAVEMEIERMEDWDKATAEVNAKAAPLFEKMGQVVESAHHYETWELHH